MPPVVRDCINCPVQWTRWASWYQWRLGQREPGRVEVRTPKPPPCYWCGGTEWLYKMADNGEGLVPSHPCPRCEVMPDE